MLFRDAFDGGARCLADECPHRLAPLSEGRLVDADGTTRVECSYHGWQFEGRCGSCALLPQLDEAALAERKYENWGARYGARTHAVAERQGIVFVWLRAGAAPSSEPPVVPELEEVEGGDNGEEVHRAFVPNKTWTTGTATTVAFMVHF